MAFCEVLVSEIGQEHKIPWLLHQWYTWEHKPSGIYPNCTSPMKRTEEIFSLWSQNRCKNFCFLWFLCFLESFSFLPVLAFPIYALKYVVLCMSPLNICAAWHTVYYQESNFLKKTLFIVFGVKLRILLQIFQLIVELTCSRFGTRHMKDSIAYRGAILWNTVKWYMKCFIAYLIMEYC